MKLRDALSALRFYRHRQNVPYAVAVDVVTKLAKRLTAQRKLLSGALIFALGYMITMTWIASEFVKENQILAYDLNVSQTAFKMQSESVKQLSHRVDELKTANTALMIELDKKGCIRAIKNTPLPKMIKDKR